MTDPTSTRARAHLEPDEARAIMDWQRKGGRTLAEHDAFRDGYASALTWQPIETAPKETELLGWRSDCGVLLIMYTSFDRWASQAECEEIDEETLFQMDWFGTALPGIMDRLEGDQMPTHWMPLPREPEAK